MTTINKDNFLGYHKKCGGKVFKDHIGGMLTRIRCSGCQCSTSAGNLTPADIVAEDPATVEVTAIKSEYEEEQFLEIHNKAALAEDQSDKVE